MLFSSIPFILYFLPIVFLGYYILFFSRTLQNIWLLLASLFFYAWGEPVYVFIMIGSILFNSIIALFIDKSHSSAKKALLVIAIIANISVLFVFKYAGFIFGLMGTWGEGIASNLDFALPVGISFYTFQALSYVIDVYRGTTKAENPFYVGLYIAFFPQLIAGPIVQYNSIADQIRNRKSNFNMVSMGISRFCVGLGKKILLSNSFAAIADHVFEMSAIGVDTVTVPAALAWLGSIAYTLQIFFDFSAYSDMAIGLGLCFGFRLPENFNYPYIADSVTDFWKRWHISLTDWFRYYVYFPLGGNRVTNKDFMVRNMFIVWLLTGIWHGANWTFIIWGLFYFVLQLFERFVDFDSVVTNKFIRHIYTLFVVNILWVLFRADDLYQAGRFIMNMFGINNNGFFSNLALIFVKENIVFFIAGIIFCIPVIPKLNKWFYNHQKTGVHTAYTIVYPIAMIAMVLVCICYLTSGSYNPFIYFNF